MKQSTCFSEFAKYCSLNVAGMLALSCYVLADTYFVANGIGPDGLTALNLAIPVYSVIHGLGLMLGMGGATRFSILIHQGRERQASAAFTHALVMMVTAAVCFVLLGLFAADGVARLLGAEGAVFPMTRTYARVMLLFAPCYMTNDLILCFVRNDGAPQRAMVAMVSGSLANILLDYIFIFPMGMGILGAVLATAVAPILSLAILSPFFLRGRNHFRPVPCPPQRELVGAIVACGVPSLVAEVSSGGVMLVFNLILLRLGGNLAVAAYGVVANLALVTLAIYSGIAQGVQPLMSKHFGAGRRREIVITLRYALVTAALLSAAIYTVILLGAHPLAMLFNRDGDPALQAIAVEGLKLYFTNCPFAGVSIVLAVYFTSTDNPFPAHVTSLLRGFVLVLPLAFGLSALWGMTGLWLTVPLTEVLTAALAGVFYLKSEKK